MVQPIPLVAFGPDPEKYIICYGRRFIAKVGTSQASDHECAQRSSLLEYASKSHSDDTVREIACHGHRFHQVSELH
jgi:hypothetical protein